MTLVQHTSINLPLGRTSLFIILMPIIILSILVICLLTNTESCNQYPVISVSSIHNFRDFLTVIFSLVMFHDIISDSGNIDNMLLLGDEVGGNIYMTGDGHTEGAKVICEKGCIAK